MALRPTSGIQALRHVNRLRNTETPETSRRSSQLSAISEHQSTACLKKATDYFLTVKNNDQTSVFNSLNIDISHIDIVRNINDYKQEFNSTQDYYPFLVPFTKDTQIETNYWHDIYAESKKRYEIKAKNMVGKLVDGKLTYTVAAPQSSFAITRENSQISRNEFLQRKSISKFPFRSYTNDPEYQENYFKSKENCCTSACCKKRQQRVNNHNEENIRDLSMDRRHQRRSTIIDPATRRMSLQSTQRPLSSIINVADEFIPEYETLPKTPNAKLNDGTKLTTKNFIRCKPPKQLLYRPLEEVDPYYRLKDKTFIFLTQGLSGINLSRFNYNRSLFIFSPTSAIRRICCSITSDSIFNIFIISIIIANCIVFAMNIEDDIIENSFLAIYILESVLRIVAKGFVLDRHSYLRDPWNVIDFFTIILSLITIILDVFSIPLGNIAALRAFRVFRALKTFSVVSGLRIIVSSLLKTIRMFSEVMILIIFALFVFSLFSTAFFMGSLKRKCVLTNLTVEDVGEWMLQPENWYQENEIYVTCGSKVGARRCPANFTCVEDVGDNPNNKLTSFDNFYMSIFQNFQLITLDFWEDIYNRIIDSEGLVSVIYFMLIIFLGSFYLLNLMLAVVAISYEEEVNEFNDEDKQKKKSKGFIETLVKSCESLVERRRENNKLKELRRRKAARERYVVNNLKTDQKTDFVTFTEENNKKSIRVNYDHLPPNIRSIIIEEEKLLKELEYKRRVRLREQTKRFNCCTAFSPCQSNDIDESAWIGYNRKSIGLSSFELTTALIMLKNNNTTSNNPLASTLPTNLVYGKKERNNQINFSRQKFNETNNSSISLGHEPSNMMGSNKQLDNLSRLERCSLNGIELKKKEMIREIRRNRLTQNDSLTQLLNSNDNDTNKRLVSFASSQQNVFSRNTDRTIPRDQESTIGYIHQPSVEPNMEINSNMENNCNNFGNAPDTLEPYRMVEYTLTQKKDSMKLDILWKKQLDSKTKFNSYEKEILKQHQIRLKEQRDEDYLKLYQNMSSDRNCDCTKILMKDLYIKFCRIQNKVLNFVSHPLFDLSIITIIIFNTALMTVEHHNQPAIIDEINSYGNYVSTAIFVLEALLKLFAFGKIYFQSTWNLFDLIVVVISLADLGITNTEGLSVLRTFRLARVFKLAQSWKTMKNLLGVILSTMADLIYLVLVLFIVIFIFAILGMKLLGPSYKKMIGDDNTDYYWHFKDFSHSFLLVFRVLCGEWIEPLRDCEATEIHGALCGMYFIPTLMIVNFIVLNLFLALLISSFEGQNFNDGDDVADDDYEEGVAGQKRQLNAFAYILSHIRKLTMRIHKKGRLSRLKEEIKMLSFQKKQTTSLVLSKKLVNVRLSKKHFISMSNGQMTSEVAEWITEKNIQINDSDVDEYLKVHPSKLSLNRSTQSNSIQSVDTLSHIQQVSQWLETDDISEDECCESCSRNCLCCRKKSKDFCCCLKVNRKPKLLRPKHVNDKTQLDLNNSTVDIPSGDEEEESIEKQYLQDLKNSSEAFRKSVKLFLRPVKRKRRLELKKDPLANTNSIRSDIILKKIMCCNSCRRNKTKKCVLKIRLAPKCFCPICYRYVCCGTRYLLQTDNCWKMFRSYVYSFLDNKIFDYFIILFILASSVSLALEDVDENAKKMDYLKYLDYLFNVVFTLEAILKIIGYGCRYYFTNPWCLLDFIITVGSDISMLLRLLSNINPSAQNALRILKTLRALRPLRVIYPYEGMRIVVNALLKSIPAIGNVLLVCALIWLIFSIIGVQQFGGKFYKCTINGESQLGKSGVTTKAECFTQNGSWDNSLVNFDNVPTGILALFQIATFEGWMELMEDGVNAVGVDMQPKFENNMAAYIYFVAFIILGSFFTLNLFVSVIIDNFNVLKKKYEEGLLAMYLTANQRKYYVTMKKMMKKLPQKSINRPQNRFRAQLYDIVTNNRFEMFIMFAILINMIVLATEHHDQNAIYEKIQHYVNIMFIAFYTLEAVIKLIALSKDYFRSGWNIFDLLICFVSIMSLIYERTFIQYFSKPTVFRVMRVFRIGKLLRVIRFARGIRKLLFALFSSLPALVNISSLLGIILFMYSIIGMMLFKKVKHNGYITETSNFETFFKSFAILVRIATAAGWNDVHDALSISTDCEGKFMEGNCGNFFAATTFCCSFIVLCYLIIINMYIAVILDNFTQAHEQEAIGVTEDDFELFYAAWEQYDPLASQFISLNDVSTLLDELQPPLRVPKPNEMAIVAFDLPIIAGDMIHCLDVLHAVTKYILRNYVDEQSNAVRKMEEEMDMLFRKKFPQRIIHAPVSTTMLRKKEDMAARILQRSWKRHVSDKRLKLASCINQHFQLLKDEKNVQYLGVLINKKKKVNYVQLIVKFCCPEAYFKIDKLKLRKRNEKLFTFEIGGLLDMLYEYSAKELSTNIKETANGDKDGSISILFTYMSDDIMEPITGLYPIVNYQLLLDREHLQKYQQKIMLYSNYIDNTMKPNSLREANSIETILMKCFNGNKFKNIIFYLKIQKLHLPWFDAIDIYNKFENYVIGEYSGFIMTRNISFEKKLSVSNFLLANSAFHISMFNRCRVGTECRPISQMVNCSRASYHSIDRIIEMSQKTPLAFPLIQMRKSLQFSPDVDLLWIEIFNVHCGKPYDNLEEINQNLEKAKTELILTLIDLIKVVSNPQASSRFNFASAYKSKANAANKAMQQRNRTLFFLNYGVAVIGVIIAGLAAYWLLLRYYSICLYVPWIGQPAYNYYRRLDVNCIAEKIYQRRETFISSAKLYHPSFDDMGEGFRLMLDQMKQTNNNLKSYTKKKLYEGKSPTDRRNNRLILNEISRIYNPLVSNNAILNLPRSNNDDCQICSLQEFAVYLKSFNFTTDYSIFRVNSNPTKTIGEQIAFNVISDTEATEVRLSRLISAYLLNVYRQFIYFKWLKRVETNYEKLIQVLKERREKAKFAKLQQLYWSPDDQYEDQEYSTEDTIYLVMNFFIHFFFAVALITNLHADDFCKVETDGIDPDSFVTSYEAVFTVQTTQDNKVTRETLEVYHMSSLGQIAVVKKDESSAEHYKLYVNDYITNQQMKFERFSEYEKSCTAVALDSAAVDYRWILGGYEAMNPAPQIPSPLEVFKFISKESAISIAKQIFYKFDKKEEMNGKAVNSYSGCFPMQQNEGTVMHKSEWKFLDGDWKTPFGVSSNFTPVYWKVSNKYMVREVTISRFIPIVNMDNYEIMTMTDVYCQGRVSRKTLPELPNAFSFTAESMSTFAPVITVIDEFYDYNMSVFRIDVHEEDVVSQVADFNTGLLYVIDRATKECQIELIPDTGVYTQKDGKIKLMLKNPQQFFYYDKANFQYAGQTTVRDNVKADVFVGYRTDYHVPSMKFKTKNYRSTWTLYFASTDQAFLIDNYRADTVPVKMTITVKNDTDSYFRQQLNIFNFSPERKNSFTTFDISSCYVTQDVAEVMMTFYQSYEQVVAPNIKLFKELTAISVLGSLVTDKGGVFANRLTQLEVQSDQQEDKIYVTFKILAAPQEGAADAGLVAKWKAPELSVKEVASVLKSRFKNNELKIAVDTTDTDHILEILPDAMEVEIRKSSIYHPKKKSTRYNNGAMAGIAVAMLVAGSVIGAVLFVFVIKKHVFSIINN
ncbi:hypothetical protein SNEBB_007102 [Seison nebaliae]|nr:hypothetical protein SNEBB_007102 [Seison nebaliae]